MGQRAVLDFPQCQRGAVGQMSAGHFDPARVIRVPTVAPVTVAFLQEEAVLIAEGVEVEMEDHVRDGVGGGVDVGDDFVCRQRLCFGVESDLDGVGGDGGGERCLSRRREQEAEGKKAGNEETEDMWT